LLRGDPKLVAILVTSLIVSTLAVLTVFRISQPDDLSCLTNDYPDLFVKESAQKGIETSFSFSAISGRELEELELRFSVLYERSPPFDTADWQPDEADTLEDVVPHLPAVAMMKSEVSSLGGESEVLRKEVDINGTPYDGLFFDFSRFMGIFDGDQMLSRYISMYAILKKGSTVRFFEGRTGFFLAQDDVVEYLSISAAGNKTEYVGERVAEAPLGILRYADLPKDSKISVIYEVLADLESIPEIVPGAKDRLLLQMTKGYADGDLALFVANPVPLG